MRCGVCFAPLSKIGHRIKDYRDVSGRVYKRIAWPRYAPCPRLEDATAHPARHRKRALRAPEE